MESAHKVRVAPGLPHRFSDLGVCITHHSKEVISVFLGLFFDLYALGFEIFAKLVVVPGRVDIVLGVVRCARDSVSDAGRHARESLGDLMSGVGVSGKLFGGFWIGRAHQDACAVRTRPRPSRSRVGFVVQRWKRDLI